jgi:hypothetical protein
MKTVHFSQHALEKSDLLARHGFNTSPDAVIQTILNPDKVEHDSYRYIAQRQVSDNTVLCVAYTEDVEGYFVITFYPGERKRYED